MTEEKVRLESPQKEGGGRNGGVSDGEMPRILNEALLAGMREVPKGETASYIPELSRADKTDLGICIYTRDGKVYEAGDAEKRFSIQSISKVISLCVALQHCGFEKVFDTDLAADMTIVEEAHEFVERVKNGGVLPMITSCSPGWIKYCEHYHPDMIPNLSTCKSPQQMFGATVKTWYAEKMGWDKKDIVVVGVMPCTAKKFEVRRDDEDAAGSGIPDVDIALTTREIARMIDRAGIQFTELPDEEFDSPMGESTGASVIFGATGGVMEAALRTAAEWVGGKPLEQVEFTDVRGTAGVKEASYQIGDLTVNVAVASGLANAKKLLEQVKRGMKNYHFIEIMGCPGGCVNGGGQPVQPASVRNFVDLKSIRAKALYDADEAKTLRKSHENPALLTIYKEYFGEFGSHLAHRILHTSYTERSRF